jgi:hypothetical protein
LGAFASAGENDSIAIGYNSRADNVRSLAIGTNTSGTATDDITLGYNTTNTGNRSITIGNTAASVHLNAITIGYGAASHADNTAIIGSTTTTNLDPNTDAVTALGSQSYRFSDVMTNKVSVNATTTNAAVIDLFADAGITDDDKWTISAAVGGDFAISSFVSGVDVNKLSIANTGDVVLLGDVALNSDERLKTTIHSITNSLALVMQLDGKTYHWKDKNRAAGEHLGFIAQDIETILPNLVSEDKQGIKSVNYQSIVPVLNNALKELNQKSDKRNSTISELQDFIEQQQSLIVKLYKQH